MQDGVGTYLLFFLYLLIELTVSGLSCGMWAQ